MAQVNLADARLNVDWTEDFRTKDPVTTRLTVKGADDRRRRGRR